MANEEHLAILRQGVTAWHRWRKENPDVRPDLREADLQGADLEYTYLGYTRLQSAILDRARLGAAHLTGAEIQGASLRRADLRDASLIDTHLERASLQGADLRGAHLFGANLRDADLQACQFTRAWVGGTIFDAVDLRGVQGLDTIQHNGRSTIGIDTLYRSQGQIPESFLRGCGVPDSMIEYARSLVAAQRPIDYYSVFISYSSEDEAVAHRLHADLQARGVRCWFAPHDLEIGAPIVRGIDEAIRIYDKLLIILSEAAVTSRWVDFEVSTALHREVEQGRTMLFPIRLDDAVLHTPSGWAAQLRTRNIGDFRGWKDHDRYQEAFTRLLRDLKAKDQAGT